MLCERCQKNQASVHMAQFINGYKVEQHLCEQCAREAGLKSQISFEDIFQSFLNLTGETSQAEKEESHEKNIQSCPDCGATYDDIRKIGKLGCPSCFPVFQNQLDSMLKSIHGSSQHKGKFPVKNGMVFQIRKKREELKKQLAEAIAKEEFEDAARLRDEIRLLEKEE